MSGAFFPTAADAEFDNKVLCVGCNYYGQLGLGHRSRGHPPYIPTQFGCGSLNGSGFPQQTGGTGGLVKSSLHSAIARAARDSEKELSLTEDFSSSFVNFDSYDSDSYNSSVPSPTIARKASYSSGSSSSVQPNNVQDIQCGSTFTTILEADGRVKLCGSIQGSMYTIPTPLPLHMSMKCISVACGSKHVLLLMQGI